MAKRPQHYEETINNVRYNLTVRADDVEAFEKAKARGSWIAMVNLAGRITNADTGQLLKCRSFVTFGGKRWPKAGTPEELGVREDDC